MGRRAGASSTPRVERFGRIDILVTCAGILRDRMIFNMSEEEWDAVLAVHLKGTFNCVRHACTHMREQRYGRIITFSSGSGLFGNPGPGELRRGQGGDQRAHEGRGARPRPLRHHGERDLPGRRHAHDAHRRLPEGARAAQDSRASSARTAAPARSSSLDPDDVAPMVVYLASDQAANVNGQFFLCYGERDRAASRSRGR